MNPPATSPTAKTPLAQAERIKHLPDDARAAFARFQASGNAAELDLVILAILEDYIPHRPAAPLADLPGSTRLFEDLAFDSLAITEVIFYLESLFDISISNEEIMQVRTLADLRGFIHAKIGARATS